MRIVLRCRQPQDYRLVLSGTVSAIKSVQRCCTQLLSLFVWLGLLFHNLFVTLIWRSFSVLHSPQIVTALYGFAEIPWPSVFLSFLRIFQFVNFDFLPCKEFIDRFSRFGTFSFSGRCPVCLDCFISLPRVCELYHSAEC